MKDRPSPDIKFRGIINNNIKACKIPARCSQVLYWDSKRFGNPDEVVIEIWLNTFGGFGNAKGVMAKVAGSSVKSYFGMPRYSSLEIVAVRRRHYCLRMIYPKPEISITEMKALAAAKELFDE